MLTLKLFNGVLKKDENPNKDDLYYDMLGFVISPDAMYAKNDILKYYEDNKLDALDLNKTFHKSWKKIKESTRFELFVEQILHYSTTYGTNFEGDFIYIPTEKLDIPRIDINKLKFRIIHAYTREELIDKSLGLLSSGIALKEETLNDVLSLLTDKLNYQFTGEENIRNKEATVKIADLYNVYPKNPTEFLRFVLYKTTGDTLLIKNKATIEKIKSSSYNPSKIFRDYGLKELSTIFNRFKPLFLAYKNRSSKVINKISKLSKKHHVPLIENPLNNVTHTELTNKDIHWLENATNFSLFKALNACVTRYNGQQYFVYNIRNGKTWADVKDFEDKSVLKHNIDFIYDFLREKISFKGITFYIPANIEYALPTSEKLFVGNIPMGTKIIDDQLAVGIYWENSWGARDLDLSATSLEGKVGWNSRYSHGGLMYSGDLTSAPNGAVEYLHAKSSELSDAHLVNLNVYSGESEGSKYKIIVGSGDDISRDYMMNPNNLIFETLTESIQRQMSLGIIMKYKGKQAFVITNVGSGSLQVSSSNEVSKIRNKATKEEWKYKLTLNEVIEELGGEIIYDYDDHSFDVDLSLDELDKDTIINLFK